VIFPYIIFHPYKALAHSFRGKCILHRNAISLVLSGEKTMHFADKAVRIKSDEIHFLSTGNCMVTMELAEGVTAEQQASRDQCNRYHPRQRRPVCGTLGAKQFYGCA